MKANKPQGVQVKVVVTEEIIDHSVARDSTHCMIADAVKAAFPRASFVSVDLATIRFTDPEKGLRYTFLTPRVAQYELVRFDQGIKPDPFQFNLRRPHVTKSGRTDAKRLLTQAQKEARSENVNKMNKALQKTGLRQGPGTRTVPDRVGGQTAPMQKGKDGIPFSRRRAFGLRALDL